MYTMSINSYQLSLINRSRWAKL